MFLRGSTLHPAPQLSEVDSPSKPGWTRRSYRLNGESTNHDQRYWDVCMFLTRVRSEYLSGCRCVHLEEHVSGHVNICGSVSVSGLNLCYALRLMRSYSPKMVGFTLSVDSNQGSLD